MTLDFDIKPEHRAIFVRCAGRLTVEDLFTIPRRLWADPRYSADYDGLVDVSDGALSLDLHDLRTLAAFLVHAPATSSGRWAAVASSPVVIACGLVYRTALRRRHPFELFSTWDAACGFLRFDPALFAARREPTRPA